MKERGVAVRVGKLRVNARVNRQHRGLGLVARDVVQAFELRDAVVVRRDVARKAPLLAQDFFQEPAVGVRRHAVNLVVGGHHAQHAGLLDGGLEARQEVLAYDALRVVAGRDVRAAFGLAVDGEVLGGGDDVLAVNARPRPL